MKKHRQELKNQSRNFSGSWRKTPGRLLGTGVIRLYQLSLSGFIGGHCRHLPTCSEYGYEAIARYGLWAGGFMTLFRIIRCGPFGTHGFDPVPTHLPPFYTPFAPWRYWRLPKYTEEENCAIEASSPPAHSCGTQNKLTH